MITDLLRAVTGTVDPLAIVLRGGAVSRYHSEGAHAQQTVSEHTWRVQVILLHLWPQASRDLILAALYHDAAEGVSGDIPAPFKRLVPGFAPLEKEIEVALGIHVKLSPEDTARLKCADYLELCATVRHNPHPRAKVIFDTGIRYIEEQLAKLPLDDRFRVSAIVETIKAGELE